VEQKVTMWVCMGGAYPSGGEYNFYTYVFFWFFLFVYLFIVCFICLLCVLFVFVLDKYKGIYFITIRAPADTAYVLQNYPGRAVFSGAEVGGNIITGDARFGASTLPNNPVRLAYQLYNNFAGRPSWDPTAMLYAVRGASTYWYVNFFFFFFFFFL
jgi:hypothetical protein